MLAFHHIFEVVRRRTNTVLWSWLDPGGQRVRQHLGRGGGARPYKRYRIFRKSLHSRIMRTSGSVVESDRIAEENVPSLLCLETWRDKPACVRNGTKHGSRPSSIFPRWAGSIAFVHAKGRPCWPCQRYQDFRLRLMNPSVGRLLKETGARNLWWNARPTSPGDPQHC